MASHGFVEGLSTTRPPFFSHKLLKTQDDDILLPTNHEIWSIVEKV